MSKQRKDLYAYRLEMPFMNYQRGKGYSLWEVKPTSDYSKDYDTGRDYALKFWRAAGNHPDLGLGLSSVLLAIAERHRGARNRNLSGIEIGFLRTIGEIVQASVYAAVMIAAGPSRLRRNDLPKKRETKDKLTAAAGLIGILADAMQPKGQTAH
jgi:hypothetical protein